MAGENDQTKWVGIRPTNPAEAIPVTVAGVPACTPVEPCAAGTLFKTTTRKLTPAVADLQAVSGFVRIYDVDLNVGAPNYMQDAYTVPAGKIFVMEYLMAMCAQADPTLIEFAVRLGIVNYRYYEAAYAGAWTRHDWKTGMIYNEGEIVRVIWTATLATTDCYVTVIGHLIDKY